MKNLLITGGCGFIGSNFVRNLLQDSEEYFIVILDKLTYSGNENNLKGLNNNKFDLIIGDICDKELLKSIYRKYNFEGIINFAAETHVDRSIDGPEVFIKTNIEGTFNLLEISREYYNNSNKNFRFVHVSTDEVYGDLDSSGYFREDTPYNPSSPYSASKASSDHLVRAWNRTFNLPVMITNCSNNYGPYQFPEKLIPLMIINCLNSKKLPVYGDGSNIRDWLYVDDHCKAIKKVFESGVSGETYNIGGNNEIQNIEIVNIICNVLDQLKPSKNGKSYSELISFVTDRPGHDSRYAIDPSKIKNDLGWTPRETFKTGIKKTINWYLDNMQWWKDIQNNNYAQERIGELK